MKNVKDILRLMSVGVFTFFAANKSNASKAGLTDIDKRVLEVRKNIRDQLIDTSAVDISVDFKSFTKSNDWVNWGNWGNWNNWNNWGNWAKWEKWNNWSDFSNWQKFSNY